VKRARRGDGSDETSEEEEDNLFSSTGGILAETRLRKQRTKIIQQGTLAIERLRDANQAIQTQEGGSGAIKTLAFHPSDKIPVLCVGSADRRVRLFNVSNIPYFQCIC
jgi:U3 small nucleolar RNA-associated protein 18